MKNFVLLMICTLLVNCSSPTQNENLVVENPFLIGKWSGEGTFMDTYLRDEIGKVWVEFEIFEDNSVIGRIGDASFVETSIYDADFGFELGGKLDDKVDKNHDLDKEYFFILLVIPENSTGDISHSEANFHLKSNPIFDFDIKVGGVNLVRE